MKNKTNTELNFSNILKYIPGFRSGKKINSFIAIFYYIACFIMIFDEGFFLGLAAFCLPFIFIYGYDIFKNRKEKGLYRKSTLLFLIPLIIMFISSGIDASINPQLPKENNKLETNVSKEVEVEDVEKTNKEIKPKIEEEELEENTEKEIFKGERDLKVHFIDVGQGDSIFLELPNGENVLIDGGPKSSTEHLIKYLKSLEFDTIDHLVATHPHEDHIGGIPEVTRNWKLGKIYLPNKLHTTKIFEEMLLTFKENGYSATKTASGTVLVDEPGLSLKAIAPNSNTTSNNLNDYSIVLKLDYNDVSFIFTGDAEAETENFLIRQDIEINVDVLKVGHHGSNTSSTEAFIKKANPKYSVITCGKDNSYGHPDNIVLDRLKKFDSEIYRTDQDGTIIATSDGEKIEFEKKGNPIQANAPPKNNNESSGSSSTNATSKSTEESKPKSEPKPKATSDNSGTGNGGGGGKKQEVTGQAQEEEVYITPTGSKYHRKPCGGGTYSPVSKQEAINKGLEPCGRCY